MSKKIQDSITEAIDIIVSEMIEKIGYTSSTIGRVKSVDSFDCVVEITDSDYNCKVPRHLHTHISEGDIVWVQDLNNKHSSSNSRFIVAKM